MNETLLLEFPFYNDKKEKLFPYFNERMSVTFHIRILIHILLYVLNEK